MVRLTIDHRPVEATEGTTIMEAAATAGIAIPSMCHRPGHANHPSCMVCLVKDQSRDYLVPSCAMPVADGMEILTATEEVITARKEALELLLSDHAGDCEAPCRISCPAFMDIPLMNRLIAAGDFSRALEIVCREIALPLVLGYICPAPCEKACRRKPIDGAVSICLLKRSTAQYADGGHYRVPAVAESTGKKVAVIGTGPAGLSAAFYLLRHGYSCVLFESRERAGGMMRYDIPGDRLPAEALEAEIGIISQMGAQFRFSTPVHKEIFKEDILPQFDAVIIATGHQETGPDGLFGLPPLPGGGFVDRHTLSTGLPGVFACGNVVREQRMAIHSAAQGRIAATQVTHYLETASSGYPPPSSLLPPPSSDSRHTDPLRRPPVSVIGHLVESEWKEYLQEAVPGERVEPAGGHLAGLSAVEAILEAKRCMRCDCRKPVSCKLRIYAEEYGASRRHFAGAARRPLTRSVQHENVVYETEKCIRCGLCIEIAEKHGEKTGLSFAGRGFDVRISVPFNESVKEALTVSARECAEACPTGALAFKNVEERNNA